MKLNPDESWQKMFLDSLLCKTEWYSKECALTWKLKATKFFRLYCQLALRVRRTGGTEFGLLGTPTKRDFKDTGNMENVSENGLLGRQIAMLPTPNQRDWKGECNQDSVPTIINGRVGMRTGMKLQPAFVEWMMGFPIGWTDLNA
jgi:hypothetical protein